MGKENVLTITQDNNYYFSKANELLPKGEYLQAIKYLNKAITLAEDKNIFLKCSYYLVLAQAYSFVKCQNLSNYYYFCALDNEIFAQVAFRGLGENFCTEGDDLTARFYLNQCINFLDSSQVAQSAKQKLETMPPVNKFRVINTKTYEQERKMEQADDFMSKGKFDKAIEVLQTCNLDDDKTRAELSLAYFFTNKTEESLNLVLEKGKDTVLDLCNLLLIYYCDCKSFEFEKTKQKLITKQNLTTEEKFKIGLTFAQTSNLKLAKDYMNMYFADRPNDHELKFLYALVCINNFDFKEAKEILIDLKTLNPFNNYLFDYYLNICQKEDKTAKIEYVFNVPVSEYIKIQAKIKQFLTLKEEELLSAFLKNKSMFYFLFNLPQSRTIISLITNLSKIDNYSIQEYFNYIFLNNFFSSNQKISWAINRVKLDSSTGVKIVKDKIYTRIVLPNMLATKANNKSLYEAVILCCKYVLQEALFMVTNLKRNIIKLERVIASETLNPKVLATFLIWDKTKEHNTTSLSKICKYFEVSQEEFYEFTNHFDLEV